MGRAILANFEEILTGTFMVVMSLATLANVTARYAFNSPIPWAEELSRYAFIWLVFSGAVVCTKHRRHICIDSLVVLLPRRAQLVCRLLAEMASLALMLIVLYYGAILAASATHLTSTLNIPTYVVYIAAPVSAALILLRSAGGLWQTLHAVFGGELSP